VHGSADAFAGRLKVWQRPPKLILPGWITMLQIAIVGAELKVIVTDFEML
jgi:hypothetical protein